MNDQENTSETAAVAPAAKKPAHQFGRPRERPVATAPAPEPEVGEEDRPDVITQAKGRSHSASAQVPDATMVNDKGEYLAFVNISTGKVYQWCQNLVGDPNFKTVYMSLDKLRHVAAG